LPAVSTPSIYHKAAKFAVTVLVVAFLINLSTQLVRPPGTAGMTPESRIISMLGGSLFLLAIPAGVIALCGIKKHGPRQLLWRGLVGILVPVLLLGMAIPAFFKVRNTASEMFLRKVAADLNKESPKMIDEITRLEKATAGPGNLLTVDVTITSLKADEIDREIWAAQVRPNLKAGIVASPLAKSLRTGSTITYRYSGSDGVKIDEISVTAEDLPKK
jgi:hypothetical protein